MAKVNPQIILEIEKLSKKELEKLVLKTASKDKSFHDYIMVNYIDKESGEEELYNQTIADLNRVFFKRYKGFSEELQMANMLSACIKRINEFVKVCKNKKLEADLIMYVLDVPFSCSTNMFGTCFTAYDYKVGLLVKRLLTVVTKKMHEDYLADYKEKINAYLTILHRTSSHINSINALPKLIE